MPAQKLVELYEMPACGDPRSETRFNPVLQDVSQMVKELEAEGVKVVRYFPSEEVTPFMRNPKVAALMMEQRLGALPITMVNGNIIKVQSYPTIEEVRSALAETAETPGKKA
ncbi:MAG: arsenic metallochaperone ArsD family protein [Chloroflexota bacterium]